VGVKTVLIADDEPANRELLAALLSGHDYRVIETVDGVSTLAATREQQPDLLLLDVMMPAPDGFEVCEKLKHDPETEAIPILLVTALSDRKSRLRGIRAGANDFITKPIDTADTILRVRNALRMKELHDLAQSRFEKLQETEAMRQEMVNMLVHDFKTPLTSIVGYTRLLRHQLGDKLSEQQLQFLNGAIENSGRLERMISSTLDVSKMREKSQALEIESVSPEALVRSAIETVQGTAALRAVKVLSEVDYIAPFECDPSLIRRVLENLCDNALRHASSEGGELRLRVKEAGDRLEFQVADNGVGIPPERRKQIFSKYSTTGTKGVSYGLGLTFCREAVELHSGEIGVRSEENVGTTFFFLLPKQHRAERSQTSQNSHVGKQPRSVG
jgi:signal transduction histidine kinase